MGDDDHEPRCNPSGNRPFRELVEARCSRREMLEGGLAAAAAMLLGRGARGALPSRDAPAPGGLVRFAPVPVRAGRGSWPAVSKDYRWELLLAWGDPLDAEGSAFRRPLDAREQAGRIGIGHDGMAYFPLPDTRPDRGNQHGVLALNHEFGTNLHVLGRAAPASLADVLTSQHAHGISIVEIARRDGRWRTVASPYARRVHANTPVRFSGPAAGHPLLRTPAGDEPRGTLNNCAGGTTPWGTFLSCEENFNAYFAAGARRRTWAPSQMQRRYGLDKDGFGYGWHHFDPRFDLSHPDHVNEENRFGWVVEVDPLDPGRPPVKRTALGRFKHETAALTVARDGRVAVYMGDDQAFEHLYKFVSEGDWRAMRAAGTSPLDHGRLYVARFDEDGTGTWLELTVARPALAAAFADQAAVLVHARAAADLLGATPMDRPEWTTVGPDGAVFCAMTGNPRRLVPDGPNPVAPNLAGHIVRLREADGHAGRRFTWDVFLLGGGRHGRAGAFASPDGLWADPDGRLFIQTDGLQPAGLNNQMLVADVATGELRRLFTGVPGAEITGIAVTPDRRTMFINVQHPGNGDPARTSFPARPPGTSVPRDATLVLTRRDGGVIGS